jgi:hypothetical protein
MAISDQNQTKSLRYM